MELNIITAIGIIFLLIIIGSGIKITINQVELTKSLEILLEMYKTTLKIYSNNPLKYEKYREQILEWQNKIEDARDEYYIKVVEESISSDMKCISEYTLKELISILEDFQKWKTGKIE